MSGRLAGKKVLVTGAAQCLGKAIAQRLAGEGAQVLVTDIYGQGALAVAEAIRAKQGRDYAFGLAHDVTREGGWAAAIGKAERDMGGLSVLVNNAGVVTTASVEQLTLERWHPDMAINADARLFSTTWRMARTRRWRSLRYRCHWDALASLKTLHTRSSTLPRSKAVS